MFNPGPIDAIRRQQEEDKYRTQILDLREVAEHPKNDFPISEEDIIRLADSILKSGGILQFPLVRELPDGSFQMLAGHRRRRASILLGDSGHPEFYETMCYVVDSISDEKAELYIIDTNIQARELSPRLRAKKIAEARELIETLKKRGELDIRSVRRAVAEITGVSESTVILQTRIAEKLIGDLMALYDQGAFTLREAYEYSGLNANSQKRIYALYREGLEGDELKAAIKRVLLQEKVEASGVTVQQKTAKRKLDQIQKRVEDLTELRKSGAPLDYELLRSIQKAINQLLN